MSEKPISEILFEISQKTGKSEEEINTLIKAKVEKFSGLLTEQGAAYMVGKELGMKQETMEQIQIGQIEDGMKGIEIKGTIESIYPVKEFDKSGKKGKLKSFILSDKTGEVRVTLWNDQVDKYEITNGSEVLLSNILVTKYNDKKQVTLGFNGSMNILNKKEEIFEKIANIKSGTNGVNAIGRIVRKFPCKEFDNGERKGKLCSFQFGDETALLRATAWNDKADELEKYSEGDTIEIKNAYTKEGRFGVEIHLGYTAQINETKKELPTIAQILKENIVEKKINQLTDGESAKIEGTIMSIEKGNFVYEVCAKCGKKIQKTENGIICENCGETQAKKNAVISLLIEDDTAGIKVTAFSNNALKIIEMHQEELENNLNAKSPDVLTAELNGKLMNKKIKLYGYQKTNTFSNANEFMIREIIE